MPLNEMLYPLQAWWDLAPIACHVPTTHLPNQLAKPFDMKILRFLHALQLPSGDGQE